MWTCGAWTSGGGCDNKENIGALSGDVLMLMLFVLVEVWKVVVTRGGCCDNSEMPFRKTTEASSPTTTEGMVLIVSLMVAISVMLVGDGSASSRLLPQLFSPLLFRLITSIGDPTRGAIINSSSNRTDLLLSLILLLTRKWDRRSLSLEIKDGKVGQNR